MGSDQKRGFYYLQKVTIIFLYIFMNLVGKIVNYKINYLLFIDILKIKITVIKSINFSINAKHMYLFILFL